MGTCRTRDRGAPLARPLPPAPSAASTTGQLGAAPDSGSTSSCARRMSALSVRCMCMSAAAERIGQGGSDRKDPMQEFASAWEVQ